MRSITIDGFEVCNKTAITIHVKSNPVGWYTSRVHSMLWWKLYLQHGTLLRSFEVTINLGTCTPRTRAQSHWWQLKGKFIDKSGSMLFQQQLAKSPWIWNFQANIGRFVVLKNQGWHKFPQLKPSRVFFSISQQLQAPFSQTTPL